MLLLAYIYSFVLTLANILFRLSSSVSVFLSKSFSTQHCQCIFGENVISPFLYVSGRNCHETVLFIDMKVYLLIWSSSHWAKVWTFPKMPVTLCLLSLSFSLVIFRCDVCGAVVFPLPRLTYISNASRSCSSFRVFYSWVIFMCFSCLNRHESALN